MSATSDASPRAVRVAVVDSGVNRAHPHVGAVAGGVGFASDGGAGDDYVDRLGHGTAVTSAIQELAPSATLFALKVFDRELDTSLRALIAAIDWAAAHDVGLVNLSLGTRDVTHAGPLGEAVTRARSRGTVVIAAGVSEGVAWLPGTLEGVVRVELDWSCPRGSFTVGGDAATPIFRTCGYPRSIPGVDPERNVKGLSFAVAGMTGVTARMMAETGIRGYDDLVKELTQRAR